MTNRQSSQPHKRDPTIKRSGEKKSTNAKQVRARLRRRAEKYGADSPNAEPTEREVALLYKKPIEEWDEEELARGRTRDRNGNFSGTVPAYITREMQERAFRIFKTRLESEMHGISIEAIRVQQELLTNDEVDESGKPIVPAAVKARLSDSVLDRTLGKATTPVAVNINARLEGILANVMVDATGELSSASQPVIYAEVDEDDEEDEDEDES